MSERRRDWWLRAGSWVLVAILVALIAFCGVWRLEGGRWERVETPSMGTVAPVGTLLWVKPVPFGQLRPGDFITFHPPGEPAVTYSHRVYRRYADGTISTKGVIPAPDPWRLHASDIVGQVRMRWWGVGWIVTAAPVLLVGGFIVAAIRSVVRRRWKLPVAIVLGSLVVTIAISWYRPFLNAEQLSSAPGGHGGADATYVGTGLLPIRVQAYDGPHVDLRDGQVGTVHISVLDADRKLSVSLSPAIPWWWWVALVLICFLPALYSSIVGRPPAEAEPEDRSERVGPAA